MFLISWLPLKQEKAWHLKCPLKEKTNRKILESNENHYNTTSLDITQLGFHWVFGEVKSRKRQKLALCLAFWQQRLSWKRVTKETWTLVSKYLKTITELQDNCWFSDSLPPVCGADRKVLEHHHQPQQADEIVLSKSIPSYQCYF